MTRIAVVVVLNLLFIACTVPVVTIGAGWCALSHAFLRYYRRDGDIRPLKEFRDGFLRNFRQATLCFLATVLLLLLLMLEWNWCTQFGGFFLVLRYGLITIAAAAVLLVIYLFPVMAAFEGRIPELIKYSLYFAFHRPHHLIILLGISIAPAFITWAVPVYRPLFAFLWFFFGFAAISMLTAKLLVRDFTPYLQSNESCTSDDVYV